MFHCVHCDGTHEEGAHDVVACFLFGRQGEIVKATNVCVCGCGELFVTEGRDPHAYCAQCHAPALSSEIDTTAESVN